MVQMKDEVCEHCLGLGSLTLGRNSYFYNDFVGFTRDLWPIMGDCCCSNKTVALPRVRCGPNSNGNLAMFSTAMAKVSSQELK